MNRNYGHTKLTRCSNFLTRIGAISIHYEQGFSIPVFHSTEVHTCLLLQMSSALMQEAECLWNKIWSNAFWCNKRRKNYWNLVFLVNPTHVYIFCEVRNIPWRYVGIDHFAAWSLASTASERNPQHSAPHIKKYVSQETQRTTFSVGVALCPPVCAATFP